MTITNTEPSDFIRFKHLFLGELDGFKFYTRSFKDRIHTLIKRIK